MCFVFCSYITNEICKITFENHKALYSTMIVKKNVCTYGYVMLIKYNHITHYHGLNGQIWVLMFSLE